MSTADRIIRALGLKPHPEGGYYRETYRSEETIAASNLPPRYEGPRVYSTAIYFMLTSGNFSCIHRIKSDEIFHFYLGDPVEMLVLNPNGSGYTIKLGPDIGDGMLPQVVVPAGVWQGLVLSEGGSFALLGTTVSPGFDFADFEIGIRKDLVSSYPHYSDIIIRLTRQ